MEAEGMISLHFAKISGTTQYDAEYECGEQYQKRFYNTYTAFSKEAIFIKGPA